MKKTNKNFYKKAIINFGMYPQTIKDNNVTISGTPNENGYYTGSDGEKYEMLKASPFDDNYLFSNGETIIENKEYYFKVEPIKWKILQYSHDKALIFSEYIIDTHIYDERENNYETSSIRKWLNNEFLYKAFKMEDRNNIVKKVVNNSIISTLDDDNDYVCSNTKDNVFLLSRKEIADETYGFLDDPWEMCEKREKELTDYAKAKEVYVDLETKKCDYFLRTPYRFSPTNAIISSALGDTYYEYVYNPYIGVVPALVLKLKGENEPEENGYNFFQKGNIIEFGSYPQTAICEVADDYEYEKDREGFIKRYDGSKCIAAAIKNPEGFILENTDRYEMNRKLLFLFEPLKWKILKKQEDKVLLVCDEIIDAGIFDDKGSDYKNSQVRRWLNEEFLNLAFTKKEIEMIDDTAMYDASDLICNKNPQNDLDKVFLLSISDISNLINEKKKITDYARSNGAMRESSYWLRTSSITDKCDARCAGTNDFYNYLRKEEVTGLVPAIWLKLEMRK